MEQTVFNPAQMKILQMMSYIKTPQELDNLENVLSQYFAKKVYKRAIGDLYKKRLITVSPMSIRLAE